MCVYFTAYLIEPVAKSRTAISRTTTKTQPQGGPMSSTWEHFFYAAQALSLAGPIKNRLVTAYASHLAMLKPDELPREVRDEFVELGSSLSSVRPMRGETAVQASVRKMSDMEAAKHAKRIVDLLGTLVRLQLQPRQPMLRAVNGNDD